MTFLYPQPGMIVAGIITVLLFVTAFIVLRHLGRNLVAAKKAEAAEDNWHSNYKVGDAQELYGMGLIITAIAVGIWLLIAVFASMPFNPYYWGVYEKAGTISSVSNQLTDGSGDVTYRSYTYQFAGDKTRYVLDDSRAASFTKGDTITLKCTPSWHLGAADTIDCQIRSY